MQFCVNHWKQLKTAIEDRGLSHLIAKDGEQAMRSIVREFNGSSDKSDFDPLMGALNRIQSRIVEIRGLMYFYANALYGGCTMCEPDEANPNWATNWIECVADEAVFNARHLGLIGPAN